MSGFTTAGHRHLGIFAVVLAVVWAGDARAQKLASVNPEAKRVLVIGKVTTNPKKHHKRLAPIAGYVVERMADLGIEKPRVLMAKDNAQMIGYLRQGRVDWVTETLISALIFEEEAGAELILKKWRRGVPDYHTIFFVRRDSPVRRLSDLRGRTIAFEDPGSTTAYFIPAFRILSHGLRLTRLDSPREQAPTDAVGFVFSRQELNTSTWVHKRLVDAGAYNNLDWDKEDHLPTAFKKDFRIIDRSPSYPRAIEVVRGDLDPGLKRRLKEILLKAHNDPEAKAALRAYQKTTRFEELTARDRDALSEGRRIRNALKSRVN